MSNLKKCRVISCGIQFEDYKQGNICRVCRKINYQAYQERKRLNKVPNTNDHRQPYPYAPTERSRRFRIVKKQLSLFNNRDDWKRYLTDKLDELFEDKPLIVWIFSRRQFSLDKLMVDEEGEVVIPTEPKRVGRPPLDINGTKISNADAWQQIENEIDKASTRKSKPVRTH
jgi:hypothetical protein